MGGEFGQEPRTQAPHRVGMINLDVELFGQLAVDGLDDLANGIEQMADSRRQLTFLVAAGQGQQVDTMSSEQVSREWGTDVAVRRTRRRCQTRSSRYVQSGVQPRWSSQPRWLAPSQNPGSAH
jgi:hypothetical protein